MTTPASISPPRPAGSLKRRAARKNSCRPTPQILIPLSTAGFPSNNASVNTCLSTTAICTRRWTPYLPNNQHLSGKDYNKPGGAVAVRSGDETQGLRGQRIRQTEERNLTRAQI